MHGDCNHRCVPYTDYNRGYHNPVYISCGCTSPVPRNLPHRALFEVMERRLRGSSAGALQLAIDGLQTYTTLRPLRLWKSGALAHAFELSFIPHGAWLILLPACQG